MVMALIFTSCSGGSSQDAKTLNASSSQIFITKVIDGYISGANIFIDHNWNLVQDADEPSAFEDTENNRYYLRRGVEVRPGYLARWIEFCVIDTEDVANKNLVSILRSR